MIDNIYHILDIMDFHYCVTGFGKPSLLLCEHQKDGTGVMVLKVPTFNLRSEAYIFLEVSLCGNYIVVLDLIFTVSV